MSVSVVAIVVGGKMVMTRGGQAGERGGVGKEKREGGAPPCQIHAALRCRG